MRKYKKLAAIIVMIWGILFSITMMIALLNQQKKALTTQFNSDSELRIQKVYSIIESNQNTMVSIRNFFYGSNFVDEDEFKNFVSSSLKDETGMTHIGWFPKVEKNKIEEYQFLYGPKILEKTETDYLFPLTFFESANGKKEIHAMDFSRIFKGEMIDLYSSHIREEPILVPSDFIEEILNIDESIIMVIPVYRGRRSPLSQQKDVENIKGYILSVLSIESVVNKSLSYFNNTNIDLSIILHKTTVGDSLLIKSRELSESNDSWTIVCMGNDDYKNDYQSALPLLVFIISVFMTILISIYVYRSSLYTEKVEMIVAEKNKELLISRKRLDLAVEGGELGCWELDFNTGRISTNSQLSRMMGYTGNIIDSMETFFKMIHEDDRPEVISKFKQHVIGQSLFFESEHRINTQNNHWLWILTKGQVVERDREGNPLQLSGVQIDISKMKKMQNILQKEATVDELTGLFNRRYFKKRLDELIEKAKRMNNNFSIALIDIDAFKEINDTYGRKSGDLVLIKFSTFLQKSLRPYDFVGRIGVDKFEIVFENVSLKKIQPIMERIRCDVETMDFLVKEEKINITFSAGLSSFSEVLWQGGDEEKLFNLAGKRLLHAKETGRNKIISQDSI